MENNLKRNKMNKETLEDFIRRESKSANESVGIVKGVIWQEKRMYSEEEVKQIIEATLIEYSDYVLADIPEWFEKFKKNDIIKNHIIKNWFNGN
jgi:hypothetical protein